METTNNQQEKYKFPREEYSEIQTITARLKENLTELVMSMEETKSILKEEQDELEFTKNMNELTEEMEKSTEKKEFAKYTPEEIKKIEEQIDYHDKIIAKFQDLKGGIENNIADFEILEKRERELLKNMDISAEA